MVHAADVIKKRDGRMEAYEGRKIVEAMRRAFEEVALGKAGASSVPAVSADELAALLSHVESAMAREQVTTVEGIQDLVERALMERGHFDVAKSYILYRHERAERLSLIHI